MCVTACSENLAMRHFVKKNLGGIQRTPLMCSIRIALVTYFRTFRPFHTCFVHLWCPSDVSCTLLTLSCVFGRLLVALSCALSALHCIFSALFRWPHSRKD